MKSFILLSFLLASTSAMAIPVQDCDFWKQKANLFMNWRQQEIPISDAVKDTSGNVSRGLLLRAYGEPIEESLADKYGKIESFTEKIHQECLLDEEKDL
ncbi:hypothetical protein [Methylophaga sp.]|uniref:hypothetical protein n=1 Tax=Methylophaga sp. TaxID=2024840 RepID=UPI003F69AE8E